MASTGFKNQTLFLNLKVLSVSTYRTNVNYISDEIIVQCFFDISRNFRMISSVHHAMFTFFVNWSASKTQRKHMMHLFMCNWILSPISIGSKVLLKIQSRFFQTVIIAQILKFTFTCLVTNWTIQWVVDQ